MNKKFDEGKFQQALLIIHHSLFIIHCDDSRS